MKRTRLVAMLLLIAMLLSLLATTGLAAAPAVAVVANSQPRHTVCTALSGAAQTYYTGDYQYETLKALPGADSTDSYAATQNNPLYTRLHTLMSSTRNDTRVVYGGTSADSLVASVDGTEADCAELKDPNSALKAVAGNSPRIMAEMAWNLVMQVIRGELPATENYPQSLEIVSVTTDTADSWVKENFE